MALKTAEYNMLYNKEHFGNYHRVFFNLTSDKGNIFQCLAFKDECENHELTKALRDLADAIDRNETKSIHDRIVYVGDAGGVND